MYLKSVNSTLDYYSQLLEQVRQRRLALENRDFDTGRKTAPGEYPLTDKSYADLLDRIAQHKFEGVTPDLRANILGFYADLNAPFATKKHADKWQKTVQELNQLRALQTSQPAMQPAGN
jgi:hypothetical protein